MGDKPEGPAGSRWSRAMAALLNPARYRQIIADINQRLSQLVGSTYWSVTSGRPGRDDEATPPGEVPIPEIVPHFEIRCGDRPCDRVKIDTCVTLCVIARNPYSNVTLRDLKVILEVVDEDGHEIPPLRDGSPAVSVIPSDLIYFGDLPPDLLTAPAVVAREAVLCSRKARRGDYFFRLKYTFFVEVIMQRENQFDLPLVRS